MSGALIDIAGDVSDTAAPTDLIAVETAGTHVGTPQQNFTVMNSGQTLTFYIGQPFIADATLYALLGGATATLVIWSD